MSVSAERRRSEFIQIRIFRLFDGLLDELDSEFFVLFRVGDSLRHSDT